MLPRFAPIADFFCESYCDEVSERNNMIRTVLLILVILMLLGSVPAWPYSAGWGYYPSGGLGLVLLILVILMIAGVL